MAQQDEPRESRGAAATAHRRSARCRDRLTSVCREPLERPALRRRPEDSAARVAWGSVRFTMRR
ncbi:hypothetical protein V1260_12045 [Brachybacterium sp. J144]|uniref:hypothetical protein n=1 Tax=Brachybacterium sp. J144 TaxID=3116487 RepID=UPI002E7A1894|nr:hypothetical protein [Brachybacterium sp. J144]MEE1651514.1 hypothetical protein [Brachybacterium sp. J144]